jgi:hypothetical protein
VPHLFKDEKWPRFQKAIKEQQEEAPSIGLKQLESGNENLDENCIQILKKFKKKLHAERRSRGPKPNSVCSLSSRSEASLPPALDGLGWGTQGVNLVMRVGLNLEFPVPAESKHGTHFDHSP